MNAATGLLIAVFLALWILPLLWAATRHLGTTPVGVSWQRAGLLAAVYVLLFLGAAWWWHTPLSGQKSLRDYARDPALAPLRADCNQLEAAIASAQGLSNGRFAIAADGTVSIDGALWHALRPIQRRGLQALAAQVAACGDNGGRPMIRDIATGSILGPQ